MVAVAIATSQITTYMQIANFNKNGEQEGRPLISRCAHALGDVTNCNSSGTASARAEALEARSAKVQLIFDTLTPLKLLAEDELVTESF